MPKAKATPRTQGGTRATGAAKAAGPYVTAPSKSGRDGSSAATGRRGPSSSSATASTSRAATTSALSRTLTDPGTSAAVATPRVPRPAVTIPRHQFYVVIGVKGLHLRAIRDDVRNLMDRFLTVASWEIQTYLDLWGKLDYSVIHFACLEMSGRSDFMHAVYGCILEYWKPDAPLGTQIAILYALYLFYATQPRLYDLVPIPLDLDTADRFLDFHARCLDLDLEDAIYVYEELQTENAFMLCAYVNPFPGYIASTRSAEDCLIGGKLLQIEDELATAPHLAPLLRCELGDHSAGPPFAGHTPTDGDGPRTAPVEDPPDTLVDLAERYRQLKQALIPTPEAQSALSEACRPFGGNGTDFQTAASEFILDARPDEFAAKYAATLQDELTQRAARLKAWNPYFFRAVQRLVDEGETSGGAADGQVGTAKWAKARRAD